MNLSLHNFLPSPVLPLYVPGIPQYPAPSLCAVQCSAQFTVQQLAVRKLSGQLLASFVFQVF